MTAPPRTLASPVREDGGLTHGLRTGPLVGDPLEVGPRRGRARRWLYTAAGGTAAAAGAAVVDLGFVGTAFAWATVAGRTWTWEHKALLGRGLSVGRTAEEGAAFRVAGARLELRSDGSFALDVPVRGGGRLRADVAAASVTSAVLVTPTPAGGWNATQKAAGYATTGWVEVGAQREELGLGGWRDWTSGRQDRRTTWRWAAGAGLAVDGRRVGFNLSTGMNGVSWGENVVWWDGVPHPLEASSLTPVDGDAGAAWSLRGPGWWLDLEPWGVREADEDLWLVRSRYVQPIGRFRGSLPAPDGTVVAIEDAVGVTEDHDATW